MSATLLCLAIDGSGFPAAHDEPEDPEVKLASRFGLLEVLPPAREFIGREESGLRIRSGSENRDHAAACIC